MKLHYALPASEAYRAERARHPLCVAIGVFDGYHVGHQAIVRALLQARRAGERTAILTFADHPMTYLRPDEVPPQIATLAERVNAFARAGVDELFVLTFDERFASLSPTAFLDDVLLGSLGARVMVVGANFRFGSKRVGDVAFARAHLAAQGREAIGVPNALVDGERVSEHADSRGDCRRRSRAGRPAARAAVYGAWGRRVRRGSRTRSGLSDSQRRGAAGEDAAAGRRVRDHRPARRSRLSGIVSIGTNPTFDGTARTVEAWLLDFNGSLYGEELALRDFRYVRDQMRFDSVEALLAQMERDAASVHFPSFS